MSMKIGALWLKTSNDGKKYMSGTIEYPGTSFSIVVFKNEDKEKDSHPDYNIIYSPAKKESKSEDNGNNGRNGAPF